MSDFIVISLKERLNWIVDAIKENLPLNPNVTVNFSYGKIKKKDKDRYSYEYLSYSSSSISQNEKPREEADTPSNLFNNQIGQFIAIANLGETNLNVFCLDNPLQEEDVVESNWLLDELRALYDSKRQTNFQVIRIVFSYDLSRPENLNQQGSTRLLKEILRTSNPEFNKGSSQNDLIIRTCYIDNQNQFGAAIALDKTHHDLLIPRMLGDFMMLLSHPNDRYNTFSAITGTTDVFSLGYAESMYFFNDIKRFYELSHKKKVLEKVNNDINEDDSLNYDKKPFGLKNRVSRLEGKFDDVSFSEDCANFPDSADYRVDEIIKSLKPYLTEYIDNLPHSEEEQQKDYRYIDRDKIFEDYELDKDSLPDNVRAYHDLLDLAFSKEFRRYLKNRCEERRNNSTEKVQNPKLEERSGCNPFKIFFKRKINGEPCIEDSKTEGSSLDWRILNELKKLFESKEQFNRLKSKQKEIENEINEVDGALNNFRFTHHSKSIDKENITELVELKKYHEKNFSIDKMIQNWNQRKVENQSLSVLLNEDLQRITAEDYNKLRYIRWSDAFPFLKEIDLKSECEALRKQSVPFVRLFVLPETALNLVTYNIYSDNKEWIDKINSDNFELADKNLVSAINSSHIASKICMFQFLQMTPDVVDGIVDAM